jgi:hypothetical protein
MPRDPRTKIAQGAMKVDKCPEKGCDYVITSAAAWVVHMWHVHKIMIPKEDRE